MDNFSDIIFPSQDTVDAFEMPRTSIVIPSSALKRTSLLRKAICTCI